MKIILAQWILLILALQSCDDATSREFETSTSDSVQVQEILMTGAERVPVYLPLLENKRVGILVNPSSNIHQTPLKDSLISLDVDVRKIFVPEHGYRGTYGAGEKERAPNL